MNPLEQALHKKSTKDKGDKGEKSSKKSHVHVCKVCGKKMGEEQDEYVKDFAGDKK